MDTLRREFSVAETHNFPEVSKIEARNSSVGLGWKRAFMSVQEEGPFIGQFPASRDILINVIHSGRAKATIAVGGCSHPIEGGPGTITIVPDGVPFQLDLRTTVGTTHFYIRRKLLDHVIKSIYGEVGSVQLKFCAAVYDPVLEQLCNAVRQALHEPGPASTLYVEHMLHAVAAYLARRYTTVPAVTTERLTCLSERQLLRTREIIESRLGERIGLADIAREFNLSADHFGRLFKRSGDVTLYQYIIRCRVDRARQMLAETSTPIIEIAHVCGFADQVHLTRAFRRLVGTTPAAYRRVNRGK
jgi:AraC family transcriptional regulator